MAANSGSEPPFQTYGLDLPLDSFATSIPQSFEPSHPEMTAADHSAGLQVRQNFDEQVRQEITRAGASGSPVALMAIEIDRFGMLDDSHDENFRNDVVGNIASILSRNGRQGDTVAQYGSKEFAVVLPNTDTADAYCVAESVREEIESTCLLAGMPPKAVWVTVSIGLALFPRDARSTRELFAAAVAGMLEAQRTGGNRVVLHSDLELQPGTRRETALACRSSGAAMGHGSGWRDVFAGCGCGRHYHYRSPPHWNCPFAATRLRDRRQTPEEQSQISRGLGRRRRLCRRRPDRPPVNRRRQVYLGTHATPYLR